MPPEEALLGWDPTPGIVSVWADSDGHAVIWRRIPETGELVREEDQSRPWALLDRLDDLRTPECVEVRELAGPGTLRFLVSAPQGRMLARSTDRGKSGVLSLPPEEQYLVATGRT